MRIVISNRAIQKECQAYCQNIGIIGGIKSSLILKIGQTHHKETYIGEEFFEEMKTNAQVVDAWMRRSVADGAHIFTDGTTIYSYGYHFPIAMFLPNGEVLYNTSYYSSTTAKHQSSVRWAVRDRTLIRCYSIDNIKNESLTRQEIHRRLRKIPKCRKLDRRIFEVREALVVYKKYCKATNTKLPSWFYDVHFATKNLKGKSIRLWAKNYDL